MMKPATPHAIYSDIKSMLITFVISMAAGLICQYLGLPAPFLLGSLFGVWLIGGAVAPIRASLGVPRWFHIPVVLGLGTLIGGNFGPDIFMTIAIKKEDRTTKPVIAKKMRFRSEIDVLKRFAKLILH